MCYIPLLQTLNPGIVVAAPTPLRSKSICFADGGPVLAQAVALQGCGLIGFRVRGLGFRV